MQDQYQSRAPFHLTGIFLPVLWQWSQCTVGQVIPNAPPSAFPHLPGTLPKHLQAAALTEVQPTPWKLKIKKSALGFSEENLYSLCHESRPPWGGSGVITMEKPPWTPRTKPRLWCWLLRSSLKPVLFFQIRSFFLRKKQSAKFFPKNGPFFSPPLLCDPLPTSPVSTATSQLSFGDVVWWWTRWCCPQWL